MKIDYFDNPLENRNCLIRPDFFPAITLRKIRETVIAVIIETKTPSPNVIANPLIKVVPNANNTTAEIILEIFPSRIDVHARLNPSLIESERDLPDRNSSFIRSKIKILASTAIPREMMNPAIPAELNVTGIYLNNANMMIE